MSERRIVGMLIVVAVALSLQASGAAIPGTIAQVRVYQGQALVTRQISFEADAGPQEVVVANLPERIVGDSLYATGTDNVTIRAVRYREVPVAEEVRPEVRDLDDKIESLQTDQERVQGQIDVLSRREKFMDQVEQFASAKTIDNMEKGTLDPETLEQVTTFVIAQRDEIASQRFELQQELKKLKEQMELLQRQRAELAGRGAKTRREAVVFIDVAEGGARQLGLSYLVAGANWSPAYSARLNDARDHIDLEYHGAVSQTSGEDWLDVALTLSTSYPAMEAASPILSPLRINLVSGEQAPLAQPEAQVEQYKAKQREIRQLQQQIEGPPGPRGERGPMGPTGPPGMMGAGMAQQAAPARYRLPSAENLALRTNISAAELQNMELTAPDEVARLATAMGVDLTEGFAASYPLEGKISIESRRDKQLFRIAKVSLGADFSYEAVPLLTNYVYQMVECVNDSELPLLAGSYSAYADSGFSGQGELPMTAPGQSLTLGFGTESRLKASRRLEDKETSIRGGNKVIEYSYRVSLQNYMDEPAVVRVWDRIPEAPNDQVTVDLTDPGQPLSEDEIYVQQQKPRGLLRWEVEVPANSSGADAFSYTYKFQIEFDKRYNIGELPEAMTEAVQKDLEMMHQIRMGRGAKMQ